jgi:hypothetical protein
MKKKPQPTAIKIAGDVVDVNRQMQYGDPVVNRVADAIIASTMGVEVSPSDICRVLIAMKMRRSAVNDKQDTRVDIIGHTEILDRTIAAEKSGETKRIARELLRHLL